jgi:uncharacterized cupin superfamily protein
MMYSDKKKISLIFSALTLVMIISCSSAFTQNLEKLNSHVYVWNDLEVVNTKSGEKRQVFEGYTNSLIYFEVHVTTLNPGKAPHGSHVHDDMEELIIVKEGKVEQSINGVRMMLGPGSVILASPGDDHGIWNAGETQASYYILRWKTKGALDLANYAACNRHLRGTGDACDNIE